MKTYRRSMAGWWLRNPFYVWYMLRELSSVFLSAYALLLLLGLARLAQGPLSFEAWRAALATPGAIVFHAVTLLLVIYHSWTWFKVMPRTLPFLRFGSWRVPDRVIVVTGVSAAVLSSIAVFWMATP